MTVTNFYLAIIIGTLISLLVDELFGIQCGGLIVPGYLAMVIDDIPCILLVFAISFIVYVIVNYVLPKFMILFGKRKFAVTLLLGIFLKLVVELLFPFFPFATVAFRGVGAITPSLLAKHIFKAEHSLHDPRNACSNTRNLRTCDAAQHRSCRLISARH